MEPVTILWTSGATVAMMLAAACGVMWLIERRDLNSLTLCIFGFGIAASGYFELGMMRSVTAAEYGEWVRWYHLPVFLALIAPLLFVHYYLGTGRSWLMWAIIFMRFVVLVINFSVQPNFNFSSIDSLQQVPLLGEQVSAIGVAVPREWQWFATTSLVLFLVYVLDAVVQGWRQNGNGSKRKALTVGLGIAVPLLIDVGPALLTVYGILHVPISAFFSS